MFLRVSLHEEGIEIQTTGMVSIGNQLHCNFQVGIGLAIGFKLKKTIRQENFYLPVFELFAREWEALEQQEVPLSPCS